MATIVDRRSRPTYQLDWIERYRPERQWFRGRAYRRAKRLMDLTLSLLVLPFVALLFVLIALAIKIESPGGPVIFTQNRTGKGGRRFKMYKFRTMVPDAEQRLAELLERDPEARAEWETTRKLRRDPRVTPVGRFLRASSLDELPQLVNVLKGEMSLVGPRPPVPEEVEKYERWQRRRLRMRPGLTCLWTLAGRDEVDFDEWMRLDLEYIDRWSLLLDAEILLRTIPHVVFGRGAH